MTPRIRAKVGTGEDSKFYFELGLWTFDGEKRIGEPFIIGPWETEDIAKDEMKKCAQLACEAIEKGQGFEPSGKYLCMKSGGVLRPWNNHS